MDLQTSFQEASASGTGRLHRPQASGSAGAPNEAGEGTQSSPSASESQEGAQCSIVRIFRAELRKSDRQPEIRTQIRKLAGLCAQFGNELLTANYLLYKHAKNGSGDLTAPLAQEKLEADARYRAWGDRLTSYCRDAIARRVTGIIRARGREVLRGECSLPTFLRRGAILVRERGVKLWKDDEARLWCSLKVEPDADPLKFDLWVKNLAKSPGYAQVLDRLLSGEYKITQAQVLVVDGYKVSLRLAYEAQVAESQEERIGSVVKDQDGFALQIGDRVTSFHFDVLEAARRKQAIDARCVQCWRLLRGRRLKKRRVRIYRSGTLDKISRAWIKYQRTWSQQLAAAVIGAAVKAGCGRLEIPSAGMFASWYVTALDWTAVHSALRSKAEAAGLQISQIETEEERKRDLRKTERKAKKKIASAQMDAVGLQSA